jgi:hypothetical protein
MSINDSKKIIIVNVDKTDFTDTEAIRNNAQHEGVHNRYVDQETDENSAGTIYSGYDRAVENKIPDSLKGQLADGKELYDEGVLNGEFRDKTIISPKWENADLAPTDENKKNFQKAFKNAYGKEYNIDWKKYETNMSYRNKINYYYYQANNDVRIKNSTCVKLSSL